MKHENGETEKNEFTWDGEELVNPYPTNDPRYEAWFYGLDPSGDRTDYPCFFALFHNETYFLAEDFESLAKHISKGVKFSQHERKERVLTCAYRCERTPKGNIVELKRELDNARERIRRKAFLSKHPEDTTLKAFKELFEGIRVDSIFDSINLPRRSPKYVFDDRDRFNSVTAHMPIPTRLCDGCMRPLPKCLCPGRFRQ